MMEKSRLSETESMGRLENEPFSPTGSDGRLQDLSRQLELMQKERDQLQLQVNKLMTNSNGPSHRSDDSPTKLSPMVLRRKGRATVAVSKHSHAAPTSYTDHSSSISHVFTPLTNNVTTEDVPMKPQRPSKAVINSKLTVANQNWDDSRPKSWSSNMFQGLFHNN